MIYISIVMVSWSPFSAALCYAALAQLHPAISCCSPVSLKIISCGQGFTISLFVRLTKVSNQTSPNNFSFSVKSYWAMMVGGEKQRCNKLSVHLLKISERLTDCCSCQFATLATLNIFGLVFLWLFNLRSEEFDFRSGVYCLYDFCTF